MDTKVVGKLDSWDSGDVGVQTQFLNLEEGSNIVRCVSSPYQFYSHFTEDATGQTRKVRCCLKDCPVCARGEVAKPRWYVAVLNRKTEAVSILELGPQVFKAIKALAGQKNSKGQIVWGDPRGYDIDIVRGPKGANPLYSVVPQPKEALTDEEKTSIRAAMEKLDLQSMVEAPSPDDIREKLGLKPATKKVQNSFADEDDAATETSDIVASDDDDGIFDFDK